MAIGKAVFGIAASETEAASIVNDLVANGFPSSDISVLFPDKGGNRDFLHEKRTKAPEGAVAGAGAGGLIGVGLGWLVGIGSLAIPGFGPFIAAGPIMTALSGAAVGAAVGGFAGTLVGMGVPEYKAKLYESKVRGGNILVSVHAEFSEQRRHALEIFQRNGAADVAISSESPVSTHKFATG